MIFLGAGASKPFGIPTLQELSQHIFGELQNLGYKDLLNQIMESLNNFNITIDFEALYSIIKGLINPFESVRKTGPLTAYYLRNKNTLPNFSDVDYRELLEYMRKIIYEKCFIGSDKVKKIDEVYDHLFNTIKTQSIMSNLNFVGEYYGQVYLDTIVVTTNYDMAIELYFHNKGKKYIDGYEPTDYVYIKKFNPQMVYDPFKLQIDKPPNTPLLIKLHGSIWQFEKDNSLIKTIVDPKMSPTPIDIEKEMMIYPAQEKQILNYKYYPFFNLFKKIEWSKLLVIGYSFRDEPINTTFIENMQKYDQSIMIIMNPNPEKVIENLHNYVDEEIRELIPVDRIVKIRQKLGTYAGKKALDELSYRITSAR